MANFTRFLGLGRRRTAEDQAQLAAEGDRLAREHANGRGARRTRERDSGDDGDGDEEDEEDEEEEEGEPVEARQARERRNALRGAGHRRGSAAERSRLAEVFNDLDPVQAEAALELALSTDLPPAQIRDMAARFGGRAAGGSAFDRHMAHESTAPNAVRPSAPASRQQAETLSQRQARTHKVAHRTGGTPRPEINSAAAEVAARAVKLMREQGF